MKWFSSSLVVAFWAVVYSEILAFIAGTLEQLTYDPMKLGISVGVVGFIAVSAMWIVTDHGANKPAKSKG